MKDFHCVGSSKMTQHELNLTSQCAQCGKTFLHTGEHVYRGIEDGRQRMYCSYTCMRVIQRAREEQERLKEEELNKQARAKEEWENRYLRAKKLCSGETVAVKSKSDAKKKLAEAEKQAKLYMEDKFRFGRGTYERMRATKNMERWKRKAAYLRGLIETLELEEMEDRARCTSETEGS